MGSAASARAQFAEIIEADDDKLDLARAALLIAQEEYPQLTPEPWLQRLDMLAERTRDRLADEAAPLIVLQEVSRVLFTEEKFRGNTTDYYDPRNSFLNDVLDRKLGIPITLSIVYLEIGWRLGLPLEGVNFPGHFLVRYNGEAMRLLADPYQAGDIRFEDGAQQLLDRVTGGSAVLEPGHLKPASRHDILIRLLTNLKAIYINARDETRAISVLERLLLMRPDAAENVRDYGLALVRAGREGEARARLIEYLELDPAARDAEGIRVLLKTLAEA